MPEPSSYQIELTKVVGHTIASQEGRDYLTHLGFKNGMVIVPFASAAPLSSIRERIKNIHDDTVFVALIKDEELVDGFIAKVK